MAFQDAVKICLSKYADFSGRARRSEYWWFFLFQVLVSIVASIIDAILGTRSGSFGVVEGIASLALLLPGLAVGARRLHDTSKSGWWLLIALIPCVGFIVLLVFFVMDSHPDNQYGPSPKGYAGPGGAGGGGGFGGPGGPGGPGYGQPPTGPDYGQPPAPPAPGSNPYGT
jgi:uncharacterized membrane protein YhaH (DUF805 family)